MPDTRRSHLTPILQALLVTFLWSTSWVLIKFGLKDIPAISFAGLRYTFAFLVLLVVLLARVEMRAALKDLSRAQWLKLLLLGIVFYTLTQGALFVALSLLPAVTLSLILSFSPAAVALLGIWYLGEGLSRLQWAGVALFLVGDASLSHPEVDTRDESEVDPRLARSRLKLRPPPVWALPSRETSRSLLAAAKCTPFGDRTFAPARRWLFSATLSGCSEIAGRSRAVAVEVLCKGAP